jgi:hypothetical protein
MTLSALKPQAPLSPRETALLALLRDAGPQRLSMVNEEAVDEAFRRRPKLVFIHTYHPTNPWIDITREGLVTLATAERATQ